MLLLVVEEPASSGDILDVSLTLTNFFFHVNPSIERKSINGCSHAFACACVSVCASSRRMQRV